jgi:glutamate/aspartate transport system substrate-binding protein
MAFPRLQIAGAVFAAAFTLMPLAAVHAQEGGTLAKVKASGAITIGHRESSFGFSYLDSDLKPVGYSIEICKRIVEAMKAELKMPAIEVRWQAVTSANRIPLVTNGTVDIECGSTTNNDARAKDVAFAHTAYVEEVRILTKVNNGVKGIADLNGKTVATTTGTTSVQLLRKHERATGVDFKEVFGKDHADSFQLLESGRADAFVMDGQIVAGLVSKSKNPAEYKILADVLSVEPIACMMRKDDPAFKKAVDSSIQAMVKSGELAKMYDKWFVQAIPPANTKVGLPLSDATKNAWNNPNDKPMEEYAMP